MPINPTTLKALIDTQITNETVDFAITPAEVGGRMKDCVDYTTEQINEIVQTPDATNSVKGKVRLAGDLAGTADLPTVPDMVKLTTNQSINGVKTFIQQPQVPTPDSDGDAVNKLYVDELIVVKMQKTIITQSQVLQMFTTPVTILSSTTNGKVRIPLNIAAKREGSGTNYTLASNQFSLVIGSSGSTVTFSMFNTILSDITQKATYTTVSSNVSFQILNGLDNETYKLGCNVSNPTGGTGDIAVYVTYLEYNL